MHQNAIPPSLRPINNLISAQIFLFHPLLILLFISHSAIMTSKSEQATYTHGHHPSGLRSHTWRTALNSCAYLLPHLSPSSNILDIGCGPGTITVDLASYIPDGHITGLERVGDVLVQARELAEEKGVTNVTFITGDANDLEFEDGRFDVVTCHQVLQHVSDPIGVLKEMHRVTKPGGIVAVRESDYEGFTWYPSHPGLDKWRDLYLKVARKNGGEPNAGRMIHAWAREAGFQRENVEGGSSTWCFCKREDVEWWSGLWAERTVKSSFAETAVEEGFVDEKGLKEIAESWMEWGREEDAWFSVLHGEVICRKES